MTSCEADETVGMVGRSKTLQSLILTDRVAARPVTEILRQKRAVSRCKEALAHAAGLAAY